MPKIVFWDFDGTLVHPNERFVDHLFYSLRAFQKGGSREDVRIALQSAYPWLRYETPYAGKTAEWWNTFFARLSPFYKRCAIDEAESKQINELFKERMITQHDYVLYEDAKSVLQACINRGYQNCLLSNNYPELDVAIKALSLDGYFSDCFISGKIGYEKPRRELFEYAKEKTGCRSGVMVGDNPIADVLGAKNAGLKAVLVHRTCPSEADATCATLTELLEIL